ncbi:MAG: zinc metalloprotease HtpX [Tepidisphaeraceae bacterium]|jgi:heat shock protein HtpX
MSQFYNNAKTLILLTVLTCLIVWIGGVIGGNDGLLIALVICAIMNFGSYFYSDKIALATMHATEVGPEHPLYRIVARLIERAGLPMPRVYVSPAMAPNAFATGRNPHHAAVCATEGLLQMLSEDQIAGVMSHELAHVKHRDILITSIAATIAGAIGFLAHNFWWFGGAFGMGGNRRDRGSNILELLAIMIFGPIAAFLIQAAISRSREFNADSGGAEICGHPEWLASALQTLENANQRIPTDVNPAFNAMFITEPLNLRNSLAGLFKTHPPLEARLRNLIGRDHV